MEYIDEVLKVLIKMPIEKSHDEKNPNPKPLNPNHSSYPKFVETVKLLMDMKCDIGLGFEVTFDKEYKKIHKCVHIKQPNFQKRDLKK